MVTLRVLRIWLADLLARCQGFRSVLVSIGELLYMCCRVLAFVLLGGETCLFGELLIPITFMEQTTAIQPLQQRPQADHYLY